MNLDHHSSSTSDEEIQQAKFLTFELGSETYGLDITYVREIVGMQTITHVPDVPHYVRGVINLRGKVIPIMDVRARFGLPDRSYDDRTCIIVINVNEWWVGLVVDTVSEVLDIPEANIEPPPRIGGSHSHFIEGMGMVGDDVRLLLDAERLLGAA